MALTLFFSSRSRHSECDWKSFERLFRFLYLVCSEWRYRYARNGADESIAFINEPPLCKGRCLCVGFGLSLQSHVVR